MCGIVGLVGQQDPAWLKAMNSLIVHRGPDDSGEYRDFEGQVGLAMRRLSILDFACGHQPFSNADSNVWIVFNGEIFNSPELRLQLEALGYEFKTKNSDTEVLVHLYAEKGPDMLRDLNGMFGFAIYDRRKRIIFAARDRMGIKPFYYWQDGGRFAFASELKSILRLPVVTREVDHQALYHYLTLLYVPDEASIIKGICRLPAGHSLTYDLADKQVRVECYWRPEFNQVQGYSEEEWAERFHNEMRQAVKRWTLSDVPIACSLSGGLDSSALVGLLSEIGYPKVKTFSLGFAGEEEKKWDETDLARLVAEKWDTEHHEIIMQPHDLLQDLVQMVWHLDEPYAGGLPSWYIFKAVGKEVKVCLTGTGGDELFGNYGKSNNYHSDMLLRTGLACRQMSPAFADSLANIAGPAGYLSSKLPASWMGVGRGRALSKLSNILRRPFGEGYYANYLYFSDADKTSVLTSPIIDQAQKTAAYLQSVYDHCQAGDLRNGLAAVDFRTQLPEEFLMMTDRFSMAYSVEARVPFLDHHLVELAFQIPSSVRMKSNDPKYLLRKAIGGLLPSELLSAPKRGFVVPLEMWLRRELKPLLELLLNSERLRKQGLFQCDFYDRFVVPHLENRANFTWQIWAVLMFQLWHFVFIEQEQVDNPAFCWKDLIK